MSEPRNRYSTVSLILHWLIAALVIGQVLLIMAHDATDSRSFVDWHKFNGLSILVLTLVRIGWRLANPALPAPPGTPAWEKFAARAVHVMFYVVLLALPLTGWFASAAAGRTVEWYGLFNWPMPPIGGGRETARSLMGLHGMAVKLLYVLIVLHVGAALKHQFLDRDNVLHRMLPLIPRRP